MTADHTGPQGLGALSPGVATRASRQPQVLTELAEKVVRFGVPAFIACLPLEFTAQLLRLQLARIILLVVAVAFLYLVVTGARRVALPVSVSIALVAAYAAVSVLSWLLTRAPGSSNALLDVVAYPLTALLIVNIVRSEKDLRVAWFALLASGLAVALLGAFLYLTHLSIWRPDLTGLYRVNATFGDPNIMARFLTLVACAAILVFAARQKPAWLAVAALVAAAAVVPLTFSKSGYVIFPASAVLAVLFATPRRRAAAIALVALAVFAGSIAANPATRDRALVDFGVIAGTTQNGGSPVVGPSTGQIGGGRLDSVRSYLIQAGWRMFLDHPLTGVGFGGFQHALLTRYDRFLPQDQPANQLVTLSHTGAITILAEQGLAGAVLFGGFLLALAWEVVGALRRPTAWRNWIVMPALFVVPILVYSQIEGRLIEEPYLWVALGLLFAARMLEGRMRALEVPR